MTVASKTGTPRPSRRSRVAEILFFGNAESPTTSAAPVAAPNQTFPPQYIAAAVVGGVVLIGLLIGLIAYCCRPRPVPAAAAAVVVEKKETPVCTYVSTLRIAMKFTSERGIFQYKNALFDKFRLYIAPDKEFCKSRP